MIKPVIASLVLCLALSSLVISQTTSTSTTPAANTNASSDTKAKRGPVFRATKDQIKRAQDLLKQRGLYGGEATGKLNPDTRAALKKYQEAEGLKVTGTLNRLTLEKMGIELTDRQKEMQKTS